MKPGKTSPIEYYHSFWTRPQTVDPPDSSDRLIGLWDFEAMTWLVSALEIRRHSPIHLLTDTRGVQFVEGAGLAWVYGDRISTCLERIPDEIDPNIFWAASKIQTWKVAEPPAVSLDTDAILWRELEPRGRVMALHEESRDWGLYREDRQRYESLLSDQAVWRWDLQPCNTGVVYFGERELSEFYAETALRFMVAFCQPESTGRPSGLKTREGDPDPMVFAEQRLLPLCAAQCNAAVTPLQGLQGAGPHIRKNPDFAHLWGSKDFYKYCAEARVAYLEFLIERVLREFPEAEPTLARWQLASPGTIDRTAELDRQDIPEDDHWSKRLSAVDNIQGTLWIEDANVYTRRRARNGSVFWSAETLRPEAGTEFDLVLPGKEPIRIRQHGDDSPVLSTK